MKKKLIISLLLILTVCVLLCACHLVDENGEDNYSLCTLTDEDIINDSWCSQTAALKSETTHGVEYDCEKFSGVKTLKKIHYTGGIRLEINYDLVVNSGNFRMVLVNDDQIVMDLPFGMGQQIVVDNPKRSYEIRIAGESADVDIKLEYQVTENLPF